ncbi:bifunctional phosphatase PAP2/diacylglycerol kinase family protein [Frankia sp. AiPa1]|uniref:bifunctional phosphatase PAP2/diacylglycerol kinase family protein n=1 Tax=Frankia sp. AiPa1 TaxID=573492 RepID=UPI00202B4709|nr:bifunctional phosphatase PAP2/diacylglycerol kinase family protein [Frankia sp. AiPa1]MCL9762701.1 phosphatase PAP2 family protein [Frankia sp. AiPa1]
MRRDIAVGRTFANAFMRADRSLFTSLAGGRPLLDPVLPRLSHAADHGLLWWGVAGALGATKGRRRPAAARGLIGLGVASVLANGPAKFVFRRDRPPTHGIPPLRRLSRDLTTFSFPSGHAASAAAFATGVALDAPAAAVPVAALATAVAFSRVYVGVHYPGDVLAGMALGVGAGLLTTKVMPRRPWAPARASLASTCAPALPDGDGLTVVVNSRSGQGHHADLVAVLRADLPRARVLEVGPTGDADCGTMDEALAKAAATCRVLGIAGGDGSINTAAQVAITRGMPLAIFPAGTLNHFAADLGLDGAGDTVQALRAGTAVAVDLGRADGISARHDRISRIFVNTASLGGYPDMVALRERYERRLGKWPAMIIALCWVLRNETPFDVEIDGERRRVWLIFVGNGVYHPDGFAPTYRSRLDESRLDLRVVDAAASLARVRLVGAVLTGRLGRSRVYEQRTVDRVLISSRKPGALPFACDGEVTEGVDRIVIAPSGARLIVYRPRRTDAG